MDKVRSAREAVSEIKDGMTIGIGGWGPRRKPMALIRELLRSPAKDLTVVAYGGADVGLLCAAGKVKRVVFAFVSLDFIPLEPYFRAARESGAVEVEEYDEGMFLLGLGAQAHLVDHGDSAFHDTVRSRLERQGVPNSGCRVEWPVVGVVKIARDDPAVVDCRGIVGD